MTGCVGYREGSADPGLDSGSAIPTAEEDGRSSPDDDRIGGNDNDAEGLDRALVVVVVNAKAEAEAGRDDSRSGGRCVSDVEGVVIGVLGRDTGNALLVAAEDGRSLALGTYARVDFDLPDSALVNELGTMSTSGSLLC